MGGFSKRVRKTVHFRDVANVVRMGIKIKNLRLGIIKETSEEEQYKSEGSPMAPMCSVAERAQGLALDSWGMFDVFQVFEMFGGKPLKPVARGLFQRRGLIRHFGFEEDTLDCFLEEIEKLYNANPYHNSKHALDVAQGANVLLLKGLQNGLSELEVFSVMLSAVCHDVGHLGVTNDFRVKDGDEGAVTYNDRSVNEMMHVSLTYRVLHRQECDILRGAFSMKQKEAIRKIVIEAILQTDMAFHFKNLATIKAIIAEQGTDILSWTDQMPLLELIVHAADLSTHASHIKFHCNGPNASLKSSSPKATGNES